MTGPERPDLGPALTRPFTGIEAEEVADIGPVIRGKVRDVVDLGERLALIATDRLSAFDRVLGTVPYRGQVLNQLSAWWFERIADLVPTHMVEVPDPNVMVVRKCRTLPVEVVVRSRLTGTTGTSAWTLYAAGARRVYGIRFPDGMKKNDPLPRPIITPTTKGTTGAHDRPITERDIVDRGLVEVSEWDEVRSIALAVFERGQEAAAAAGLVLVDTKYEFGIDPEGRVTIIDEVHTPDSSRFWRAATAEERIAAGKEPENLDKELVRLAYAAQGFTGDGDPPPLATKLGVAAARAYLEVFGALTGRPLVPAAYPAAPRVITAIRARHRP
ncbi:MAG: phosphoribosylaminoimidazolesuccinocarboxamide synthase [bacterium]|nr:phosphoribosylaminoimidazolesuccinocarboxamide synthase [bacterium]MDE0290552.1 phosphoribosylaminoimidazolesuccinocarboxamide synthase [bacterium]MDE0436947.1 phosphoribosylaminoimidazolesuccinocarboxamide synthase [bacterium]